MKFKSFSIINKDNDPKTVIARFIFWDDKGYELVMNLNEEEFANFSYNVNFARNEFLKFIGKS